MTIPIITQIAEPPNSTQSEDEFNQSADAFLGGLPDLVDELNAFGEALNSLGSEIESVALVAAQAGDAEMWVAGTAYPFGSPVYSPLNLQSYRSKVNMAAEAHAYWRIRTVESNGAGNCVICELEFKSTAGGIDQCYAGNGTSFGSAGIADYAFDDTSNAWDASIVTGYVGFHFNTPTVVVQYTVKANNSVTRAPKAWFLECSDDNVTWKIIDSRTNQTSWYDLEVRTFTPIVVPGTVDPSLDSTNWEKISGTTDADTVDGFHASQTPVAGQIPAIKGDSSLALPGFLTVNNVDSGNANGLDYIFRSSFTLTLTGFSSTAPAGTAYLTRINRLVFLDLPTLSGTSNLTTMTATGIPAEIRPLTASKIILARVQDAGSYSWGMATIQTNGTIIFAKDAANNVFTASGTKGVSQLSNVSYPL